MRRNLKTPNLILYIILLHTLSHILMKFRKKQNFFYRLTNKLKQKYLLAITYNALFSKFLWKKIYSPITCT